MGLIVVRKTLDSQFARELQALGKPVEWMRFAVAGRMVGELADDIKDGRAMPEGPRAGPAEDLRAWRWGRDWKPGAPPPPERPEGACAECWRLGDACREHYRGLSVGELHTLAYECLEGRDVDGQLTVQLDGPRVSVDTVPFERLQARVLAAVPTLGKWLRWNWLAAVRPPKARENFARILESTADWQRVHGVVQDGLIGPVTWAKRDDTLRGLARMFVAACEEAALTHLLTYRGLVVLLERDRKERGE